MRSTSAKTGLAVLAAIAFSVPAAAPAWASTGPHWTIQGVAQEGHGVGGASEAVSLAVGVFQMEVGNARSVECSATTGTGTLGFTSPGTGSAKIKFTSCKLIGNTQCEIPAFEANVVTTLKAVGGEIYDVLSGPVAEGERLFTMVVKNKGEGKCLVAGTYPVTGKIGAKLGIEAVEPTLAFSLENSNKSGTELRTQGVRDQLTGTMSLKMTGVNAAKKFGASL
jgi:hypothetical protein